MEIDLLQQILSEVKEVRMEQQKTNNRLDAFNNRLDAFNNRLDAISNRLDVLEDKVGAIEKEQKTMGLRMQTIENELHTVMQEMKAMKQEQEAMNKRLDSLEEGQKAMSNEQSAMRKDIQRTNDWLGILDDKIENTRNIVLRMENEHGKSLTVLFDGYSLLYETSKEIRRDLAGIQGDLEKYEFFIKWLNVQKAEESKRIMTEFANKEYVHG